MKLFNSYPCECGHERAAHFYLSGPCSYVRFPFSKKEREECRCKEFKLDNLRYLEDRYEHSKK